MRRNRYRQTGSLILFLYAVNRSSAIAAQSTVLAVLSKLQSFRHPGICLEDPAYHEDGSNLVFGADRVGVGDDARSGWGRDVVRRADHNALTC